MKKPNGRFAALVFTLIAISSCGPEEQDEPSSSSELGVSVTQSTSPFTRLEQRKRSGAQPGARAVAPSSEAENPVPTEAPPAADVTFAIDTAAEVHVFRSYDGTGSSFGDVSVQATTTDVTDTSVYASVDSTSPNRVVLVLINKANTPKVADLTLSHGTAFSRAEVYQLTSATPNPTRGTDLVLTQPNALRYTMPANSVSTLVLEP